MASLVARLVTPRPRPSRVRPRPVFSSPSAVSTVSCARATTLSVSVPVHLVRTLSSLFCRSLPDHLADVSASALYYFAFQQSTSPPFSSTWLPRSSSSLVTLPVTTRSRVSFPVTFSSPSATTRSSTSSLAASPSPRVVSSPSSSRSSSPPSRASRRRLVARRTSKRLGFVPSRFSCPAFPLYHHLLPSTLVRIPSAVV